jgi:branched-chain amino acid transport system permease protein
MAENPERASLLGIGVAGLSVVVWTVAGLLDGAADFAARGGAPGVGSGFLALLIPFAGAVIGRFQSIPTTVGVCIGLGVLREAWQYSLKDDINLFYVTIFVIILVALLFQRRGLSRAEVGTDVGWAGTSEPRPVPAELRGITALRLTRWGLAALGLLVVLLFPFIASTGRVVLAGTILIYAIGVLSLVVLTGWAGQVSLGQWALVAVGSVVGGALTHSAGLSFWFAVPLVSALTAAIAVLVGLPALRIKGLFLLVTTFSFAVVVDQALFAKRYFRWLLPQSVERPSLFFLNFSDEKSMYFLCVAALALALWLVTNLRRSRVGRVLIALRDNEPNVQAFGVSALYSKLLAFAVSGALAGFAGVLYAHQQRGVSAASFGADRSIFLFLAAVIGGVSSPAGALLGAAYYEIVRNFLNTPGQAVLASFFNAGGPLLIVFVAPGGFISLVNAVRDSILRVVAQRRRIVVPSLFADYDPELVARQLIPLTEPDTSMGLAALPHEERFVMESDLYQATGERPAARIGAASEEAAAFGAAARSLSDTDDQPALSPSLERT